MARYYVTRSLTSEEIIVAIQNFVRVKCIVLLHLLFHEVFHDARVEFLAGLLVGNVILFRVI